MRKKLRYGWEFMHGVAPRLVLGRYGDEVLGWWQGWKSDASPVRYEVANIRRVRHDVDAEWLDVVDDDVVIEVGSHWLLAGAAVETVLRVTAVDEGVVRYVSYYAANGGGQAETTTRANFLQATRLLPEDQIIEGVIGDETWKFARTGSRRRVSAGAYIVAGPYWPGEGEPAMYKNAGLSGEEYEVLVRLYRVSEATTPAEAETELDGGVRALAGLIDRGWIVLRRDGLLEMVQSRAEDLDNGCGYRTGNGGLPVLFYYEEDREHAIVVAISPEHRVYRVQGVRVSFRDLRSEKSEQDMPVGSVWYDGETYAVITTVGPDVFYDDYDSDGQRGSGQETQHFFRQHWERVASDRILGGVIDGEAWWFVRTGDRRRVVRGEFVVSGGSENGLRPARPVRYASDAPSETEQEVLIKLHRIEPVVPGNGPGEAPVAVKQALVTMLAIVGADYVSGAEGTLSDHGGRQYRVPNLLLRCGGAK